MAAIRPEFGFKVERGDRSVRYRVAGEGLGIMMNVSILMGMLPVIVFCGIMNNFVPAIIIGIVVFAILQLISVFMKRPVFITISPDTVTVKRGGKTRTYIRGHIASLTMQNDAQKQIVYSSEFQNGHFIMAGSGFAGTAAVGFAAIGAGLNQMGHQMGTVIGDAAATEMANRSWSIKILYGSKYIALVKHLKQPKAESLYSALTWSFQEIW